jgi:Amt family ammonium transporter
LHFAYFQFQFAFAAAAATIVSGAVAERCRLSAYLVYTVAITGFIYPVVVHWVWDSSGFLSVLNADAILYGCVDFAGSGVVHMTGGWAALVAAAILGPRKGRWDNPAAFDGHSTPLQVIGTFLLWFGWYGFNPGSTLLLHGSAMTAARATVTTTLSAAGGGVLGLFIKYYMPPALGGTHVYDIGHTCNSLLGGLVGITAGANVVDPWAALIIGFVAAFVYHGASCLMRRLKIDDPLDAFAVHGACGLWGVLAVGIFAVKQYVPTKPGNPPDAGIFMSGTRGELFATQVVTICIEIPWVVTMSALLFFGLKLAGIYRVPAAEEDLGLDVSKHGGSAYAACNADGTTASVPSAKEHA